MLYTLFINRVNIKQIGGLQQAKKGHNPSKGKWLLYLDAAIIIISI